MCDVYSHLDGVLLSIINKGNSFIILRNAIHGHSRPAPGGVGLQDSDVIESLPIPVVYLERLPIRG